MAELCIAGDGLYSVRRGIAQGLWGRLGAKRAKMPIVKVITYEKAASQEVIAYENGRRISYPVLAWGEL